MTVPVIRNKHAVGLMDVVDACPVSVFKKVGNSVKITSHKECIGCGVCVSVCKGIKLIN